jgi:hypothetical protein
MEPMKPALKQAARLKNRRSTSMSLESFIILHNLGGSGMPCIKTKVNALKIIYQSLLACKLLCYNPARAVPCRGSPACVCHEPVFIKCADSKAAGI